jgi:large subunit ribosomal protein L18
MEKNFEKTLRRRKVRTSRLRSHIRGDAGKPRMCVVKTNKHIQVQLIDDAKGVTVVSATTTSKELRGTPHAKKNKESAKVLGEMIAKKAKAQGIERVVFDRGPFKYHGILAELADAARAGGLQF